MSKPQFENHQGKFLALMVIFLSFATCPAFSQEAEEEQPFKPFTVYQDKNSFNRYVPSGYMPTGECIKMEDGFTQGCKEGKTCVKVTYDTICSSKGRQWAGVYWLNPPDNWGDRKGGYNLAGAKKLVFWARGEKGGEQVAEFKTGGVGTNREFPDSDSASIGPVILAKEWRQYSIDLRDKDLSYISGGFAWIAAADANPDGCTFYLDDIHFE